MPGPTAPCVERGRRGDSYLADRTAAGGAIGNGNLLIHKVLSRRSPRTPKTSLVSPLDIAPQVSASRLHGVRSLEAFGSILRDDFDAARSDVDVLVDCEAQAADSFSNFLDLKESLEALFQRSVEPVAPRFCDHLRKHSLAQPGLKRSLRIPQQRYHGLFMRAARAACLFPWILVNRKNRGRLDCPVNLQQTDPICWPRQ